MIFAVLKISQAGPRVVETTVSAIPSAIHKLSLNIKGKLIRSSYILHLGKKIVTIIESILYREMKKSTIDSLVRIQQRSGCLKVTEKVRRNFHVICTASKLKDETMSFSNRTQCLHYTKNLDSIAGCVFKSITAFKVFSDST